MNLSILEPLKWTSCIQISSCVKVLSHWLFVVAAHIQLFLSLQDDFVYFVPQCQSSMSKLNAKVQCQKFNVNVKVRLLTLINTTWQRSAFCGDWEGRQWRLIKPCNIVQKLLYAAYRSNCSIILLPNTTVKGILTLLLFLTL